MIHRDDLGLRNDPGDSEHEGDWLTSKAVPQTARRVILDFVTDLDAPSIDMSPEQTERYRSQFQRIVCGAVDEHEPREGVVGLANDLRFIAALELRSFERQDFALELARDLEALAEILDSIATDEV